MPNIKVPHLPGRHWIELSSGPASKSTYFKLWWLIAAIIFLTILSHSFVGSPQQVIFFAKNVQIAKVGTHSLDNGGSKRSENSLKILIWTTRMSARVNFWGADQMSREGCPVKCEITDDKNMVDIADALVFHGTHEDGNDSFLPPQRKLNQLRVFQLGESPQTPALRNLPNIYNWTMTYRCDSDVPALYASYRLKSDAKITAAQVIQMASHSVKLSSEKLADLKQRYFDIKSGLIGWTVSHCMTTSRREELVRNLLQKELQIDIYGKCGHLNCTAGAEDNLIPTCYKMLAKKYKFYLSFENSLCWDYVTEKLFNALKHGMVPIVYGGSNYAALAPPGSYINVHDFPSIHELAEYIKFLDSHPEEYVQYFLWRDTYEIYETNWYCELCKKMWELAVVVEGQSGQWQVDPSYSKVYDNISSWWFHRPQNDDLSSPIQACRLPPKVFVG